MLLTLPDWRDHQPNRQRLVDPYVPWRCAVISAESPCFLLEQAPLQRARAVSRTWLVASVEDLVDMADYFGGTVHRISRVLVTTDHQTTTSLVPIRALLSYSAAGMRWYSVVDAAGHTQPCLAWQPPMGDESAPVIEWEQSKD